MKKPIILLTAVFIIVLSLPISATDLNLIEFSKLSKYEKYIEENGLQDTVVEYSEISKLGIFDYFSTSVAYKNYSYVIKTKSKAVGKVRIHIQHDEEAFNESYNKLIELDHVEIIDSEKVNASDLRKISESTGVRIYNLDNIRYTYNLGILSYIKWLKDGITYTISFEELDTEITLGNTLLIDQILKSDTASAAVYSLPHEPLNTSDSSYLFFVIPFAIVIVIVAIIIIKKSNRNK